MKISICDPCKIEDDKITETNQYLKVKGKPMLKMDVCAEHNAKIKKMNMIEYARYCFKINGVDLSDKTDDEVKEICLR